ncbi:hypothetical protein [Falsiroseomonas sp. E2-1-a4]|uniref:hypothetical protein n=1 Tax=Falsiroseomonas sp. E2-1-a4 TaxID=3239299 RepID=UPI003F34F622
MVGLRLDMTMQEAEAVIRAHMPVARVFETVPPSPGEAAQPAGAFRGRAFVGSDRPDLSFSERVAIFDAPSAAEGQVVAILRTLFVEQGLERAAAEGLTQKYGAPHPATARRCTSVTGGTSAANKLPGLRDGRPSPGCLVGSRAVDHPGLEPALPSAGADRHRRAVWPENTVWGGRCAEPC